MTRGAGFSLPFGLQSLVEELASGFLSPAGLPPVDFSAPAGEPALAPPGSVAWQVFRNPLSLFVGGVAAVILELAEPRVRTGVWNHTNFRTDPVDRLRRTGLAAMVTVYGAGSVAETMIAGVRRLHERVAGTTPAGEPYSANDPELLDWVQATASYGFLQAYLAFVRPLGAAERDLFYLEGVPAAHLYGCRHPPRSEAEMEAKIALMRPRLEPSPIVFDFLSIMREAEILPPALRPAQRMMVRAAVDILPLWTRHLLGLGQPWSLRWWERSFLRQAGSAAGRLRLDGSPAAQSSVRMGLEPDHLWKVAV